MARVRPNPADQICPLTVKAATSPSTLVAQRPVTLQDNRRLQDRKFGNTAPLLRFSRFRARLRNPYERDPYERIDLL
jgi:hypothetical protein